MAYHSRNGLHFERLWDGSVRIFMKPRVDDEPVELAVLPENEWASVVASVSESGENYQRWMEARLFHGESRGS